MAGHSSLAPRIMIFPAVNPANRELSMSEALNVCLVLDMLGGNPIFAGPNSFQSHFSR